MKLFFKFPNKFQYQKPPLFDSAIVDFRTGSINQTRSNRRYIDSDSLA